MFARFTVVALLLLVVGCSESESNRTDRVAERERFWADQIDEYLREERSFSEFRTWLRESPREIELEMSGQSGAEWVALLEEIPGDGPVCAYWSVLVSVRLDDQAQIEEYSLSSTGMCL